MKDVFPIVPASGGPGWFLAGLALFFVLMLGLFAAFAYSSRRVTFEVSAAGLRVTGDLYGRLVPLDVLRPDDARIIDVRSGEFAPSTRRNATGLPGYSAGWFTLRNGARALVFVTSRDRALYLPTTDGYALVMSPQDPEALLASIRRHKGA
jgi:hypothetical protein